jgi:hypothetical protein
MEVLSMKRMSAAIVLFAGLALAGCGSGTSGGSAGNAVAESQGCIVASCHGAIASKVTGKSIGDEWRASTHAMVNVAGCTTCHGHYHANNCTECHGGSVPQSLPKNGLNAEAECVACHVKGNVTKALDGSHLPELNPQYGSNSTYSVTTGWSTTNVTAANTLAGWAVLSGTPYASRCIWCHNPHDNRVTPQHKQWAESGMGSPIAGYTRTDFKRRGSPGDYRTQVVTDSCVRCHTATGFVNWVESGMTDVSAWGLKTAFNSSTTAKGKQTLYCYVCHDDGSGRAYGYGFRKIPAQGATGGQRVYHNFSASVAATATENAGERFTRIKVRNNYIDFPNIGISDRCLLCHAGRGSGILLKKVAAATGFDNHSAVNFRKINRVGVHDFAGGGTMFRALGFEYYSSYRYAQPATIPYFHDQIGQTVSTGGIKRGPCVSCHMSSAESHSFMPVSESGGVITSINTSVCITCHASGKVGFTRFDGTVAGLNVKKAGYAAALKAMSAWLTKKGISSTSNWLRTSTYPAALTLAGFNQAACTPAADRSLDNYLGSRNMGAGLNRDFLVNDPGGFVHNDLYVKRLIYDTLDWVDNCTMDKSVQAAIDFTGNSFFPATSQLTAAERSSAIDYLMGASNGDRPGDN